MSFVSFSYPKDSPCRLARTRQRSYLRRLRSAMINSSCQLLATHSAHTTCNQFAASSSPLFASSALLFSCSSTAAYASSVCDHDHTIVVLRLSDVVDYNQQAGAS